jgi:hypothetical protein
MSTADQLRTEHDVAHEAAALERVEQPRAACELARRASRDGRNVTSGLSTAGLVP